MDQLRTAAQQALEALEKYRYMMFVEAGCRFGDGDAAITALRAALEQPEQELYTLAEYTGDGFCRQWVSTGAWLTPGERIVHMGPSPQAPQPMPEQEPVATVKVMGSYNGVPALGCLIDASATNVKRGDRLYTHPPRREWRGLMDEERRDIREWKKIQEELGPVWAPMMLYLYLAIEAALRSKNYE